MKTQTFRTWITTYLTNFIQAQLAITCISLPILMSWGLGFSWMSIIGNLIFAPVLMIFLILSTLLLITHIIGLPNSMIAYGIEHVTTWWLLVLEQGSPTWVYAYAKPPMLLLIAIPIAAFWLIRLQLFNTIIKRCVLLCGLIILLISTCSLQRFYNNNTLIATQFHEKLYAIKLINQPSVILVDNGFFSRKKTVTKVIDYEIKPWLAKQYGTIAIKELRIAAPSAGAFNAAQHLCTTMPVEAVWLAYFDTILSKGAWRAFFILKELLENKKIRFIRR